MFNSNFLRILKNTKQPELIRIDQKITSYNLSAIYQNPLIILWNKTEKNMTMHYATPDNAALLKYIPETSIITMKYTSFNASYRIKKRLADFVERFSWLLNKKVF